MKKILFFILYSLIVLNASSQNSDYVDYIENYKDIAIQEMYNYGIPASITLAQGLLESGAGKGRLAVKANNHFGIKCHKEWTGPTIFHDDDKKGECFRKYGKAIYSFEDHSKFLKNRSRYAFLFDFDKTDYKSWAFGLKQAGYATDPKYPTKLIKLIDDYQLNQYDTAKGSPTKTIAQVSNNSPKIEVKEKKSLLGGFFKSSNKSQIDLDENKVFDDGVYIADIDAYRTHEIEKINGVKCVIAKEGDTYASLADEFNLYEKELLKANEVKYGANPKTGDLVFIARKKRKAVTEAYMFREGDTMYSVSQLKGIRVRSLYKMNDMIYGKQPEVGTMIKLR